MQQSFSNLQEFLRSIKILHGAMFIGMVMIALVLKFLMAGETYDQSDLLFPAIGIGLAISGLVIGHLIFKNRITSINKKNLPLVEKLSEYNAAYILKLAMLEGPALVCLILHFLGGNSLLLYTFDFILVMFGLEHPTKDKVTQTLSL